MASFAECLDKAMTEAKLGNDALAKHIAVEDTKGVGISDKTIYRWRSGKIIKGNLQIPHKREYILDMIKPLHLAQKGQAGLEECNALLQAAGFFVLDGDEQNKYFHELKDETPFKTKPSHKIDKTSIFAYDDCWVGREKWVADLSAKALGNYRLLILVGITGIGKTALGEKLAVDLQNNWTHFDRVNFDDEAKLSDFASVASELLMGWGEAVTPDDSKDPNKLLLRLVKRLRNHQHLLLIDSLENILTGDEQEGWSEFKDDCWPKFFQSFLAAEVCQSLLILTSQDLPTEIEQAGSCYPNLFHPQPLMGLEGDEQLALFGKTGLDVGIESEGRPYLKRIAQAYEGHPLALRTIAGEIGGKPFYGNVLAYWNKYANEIEEVEKAIEEETKEGRDKFKLHSYTKALRKKLHSRLQKTFERLERDVRNAYLLLCLASVYRCEVPESFWLRHLEYEGCDKEQQQVALDALRDRYLIEEETNNQNEIRLRQHNLIRSVALECLKKLDEEDE
ncbi:MAG: ATP-binding protein [Candidatus Parabeggiatoa sp. nov. 3]|nr:MAG: ATP-binding protein [Gammaproteobacteria bacterium]RKZ56105.1 MAG: ATP-binding protein [Gammaproteobacteria bacterium]RKZ77579.1 MAG: ATP-binding protein [Gammaproteobacteria bacterium]HEW97999.1 ATP-binding protein [Beggiatoa sp.]